MTDDRQTKNAASEGTSGSPCSTGFATIEEAVSDLNEREGGAIAGLVFLGEFRRYFNMTLGAEAQTKQGIQDAFKDAGVHMAAAWERHTSNMVLTNSEANGRLEPARGE